MGTLEIGLIYRVATVFVPELTLSVALSRPGTEVLAVQFLRFADRIEAASGYS